MERTSRPVGGLKDLLRATHRPREIYRPWFRGGGSPLHDDPYLHRASCGDLQHGIENRKESTQFEASRDSKNAVHPVGTPNSRIGSNDSPSRSQFPISHPLGTT